MARPRTKPKPRNPNADYSTSLRLPLRLHRALKAEADRSHRSLAGELRMRLENSIKAQQPELEAAE